MLNDTSPGFNRVSYLNVRVVTSHRLCLYELDYYVVFYGITLLVQEINSRSGHLDLVAGSLIRRMEEKAKDIIFVCY